MTVRSLSPWQQTALYLGIATVAAVVAVTLQWVRLDRLRQAQIDPVLEQEQFALQLAVLDRLPSFGFKNLLADWTFLQYLQYFGDEAAREQTGCTLNATYLDLVTRYDPRFFTAYLFVPSGVSYCQGEPERSITLLDRGLDAMSADLQDNVFSLAVLKALDRLLLLGDVPKAIADYEQAADIAAQSERFAHIAPRLRQTAEFLRNNPNSIEPRFIGWQEVYYNATDDRVRERAIAELKALGAEVRRQEDGTLRFVLPPELRGTSVPAPSQP